MNFTTAMNFTSFLTLSILAIINCQSVSDTNNEDETFPPTSFTNSFVTVKDGNFILDGRRFHFAGTNAYYLPNYQKINPQIVDQTLSTFQATGISVVRIWGFYDGPPQYNEDISFQPQPGVYNEAHLRFLDDLIAKGRRYNIRFVIALGNYWDELGGMPQYNAWDENPNGGMLHFITDATTQGWYKKYIYMLVNRINSVTGIAYKDDPAIFSWEIMNEGRMPGRNPEELRDWYQKMAKFIKLYDSNHLISTGEEGFDAGNMNRYTVSQYSNTYALENNEGTSYVLNTSIPEIDYGTAHWYPEHWGYENSSVEDLLRAQHAWIDDHARIAQELGKPFVLGEYGFSGWGGKRMSVIYNDLWRHAEKTQLDGSLLWQLTIDYVKCYEFGGNICWPGGRQDRDLYYDFRTHIQAMKNIR